MEGRCREVSKLLLPEMRRTDRLDREIHVSVFAQMQKEGGEVVSTSTETLIAAMHILATEIQSDDGVANAAVAEAAQRLEEQQERIKRMEEVGDKLYSAIYCGCLMDGPCKACSDAADMWDEIKEAKP